MPTNVSNAISAYNQALRQTKSAGMESRDGPAKGDFADLVKDAAGSMVESLKAGEQMSIKAAAGQADMQEDIMAVTNAELTLQMAVSVRDKVIQAYQDILRMPI